MIAVAILGHGVVGSGVVEVLQKNAAGIAHKAGEGIEVKRILDLREFPALPYAALFTKDFQDILGDEEIRIVVETMGGLHPAYEYVKSCLLAGKSVVTSNKELVAAKGDELLEIARNNNLNFLFEASVGGGIPILRPLDQCLAANEVYEIAGILNGTTNFMLSRMVEDDMPFGDALALAQKLGYAERNPAADIEGHDACRKICILASLAFGKHVYPEQVHTEGIAAVTLDDVKYAGAWGGEIKLLGRARREEDGRLYVIVAPMVIPSSSLLADVDDVFNGIMVRGRCHRRRGLLRPRRGQAAHRQRRGGRCHRRGQAPGRPEIPLLGTGRRGLCEGLWRGAGVPAGAPALRWRPTPSWPRPAGCWAG